MFKKKTRSREWVINSEDLTDKEFIQVLKHCWGAGRLVLYSSPTNYGLPKKIVKKFVEKSYNA